MKKLYSKTELSLDELLDAIKGQELVNDKILPSFKDPIFSFTQAFNISPGTELISDHILHKLFKLWHRDSFIDLKNFNIQLGKYIPSERKNRRFYKVNKKISHTVKILEEIQNKHTLNPTKYRGYHRHFERFLSQNDIEAGEVYVESDILYYVYNRWCDEIGRKNPLGYNNFLSFCALNFEVKRMAESNIHWYGVNDKIKKLITRSEVERWRQGRTRYAKTEKNRSRPDRNEKEKTLYYKKQVKKK